MSDAKTLITRDLVLALDEAGFAVVPKLPTSKMIFAAINRPNAAYDSLYVAIWTAMVAEAAKKVGEDV